MLLRQAIFVDKRFSKRAAKRGRAYSMEGNVFNVSVEAEGGGPSSSSLTSFLYQHLALLRTGKRDVRC